MKPKKLQREIDRAVLKVSAWTSRLASLRALESEATAARKNESLPEVQPTPAGDLRYEVISTAVNEFPPAVPAVVLANVHRFRRYAGLYRRVAAKLGVTPTRVGEVARGMRQSVRIGHALLEEVSLMDAEPWHPRVPGPIFAPEVMAGFLPGGKYHGLLTSVARSSGASYSTITKIIHGNATSRRLEAAVRAEMARVDAELAAKEASHG